MKDQKKRCQNVSNHYLGERGLLRIFFSPLCVFWKSFNFLKWKCMLSLKFKTPRPTNIHIFINIILKYINSALRYLLGFQENQDPLESWDLLDARWVDSHKSHQLLSQRKSQCIVSSFSKCACFLFLQLGNCFPPLCAQKEEGK